jgi:rod shape-determining protein MreD
VWRDVWQDWLTATAVIAGVLIAGRLIATKLGAHVETALLLQILASAAAYPFIARLTAALDPRGVSP